MNSTFELSFEEIAGEAVSRVQLQGILWSFLCFGGLHLALTSLILPRVVPAKLWERTSERDRFRVAGWALSIINAVLVSGICVFLILVGDVDIDGDHFNGSSELSFQLMAILTGYFVWDIFLVFSAPEVNLGFLAHHVGALFCLFIFQHPFAHFYAVRCIIWEISTPFLSFRSILLTFGQKGNFWCRLSEKLFGLTFLFFRIILGIPFSVWSFMEGRHGLSNGGIKLAPHYFALLFFNVSMCFLNVVWSKKILEMAIGKKKPD